MLTIDQLEKYETLDVESSVKTSTSQYGKKLKIKHAIFNKLAKIDEDYFSANFEKVVNKKASLKTIVTQFQEVKDIADDTVAQLKNKDIVGRNICSIVIW